MKYNYMFFLIFLVVCNFNISFAENLLHRAKSNVKKSIDIRKQLQIKEDKWMEERKRLKQKYENLMEEIKLIEYQNMNLKKQKLSLENSIKRLNEELKKAGEISEGIMPYLNSIYKKINEFVNIDIPFLKQERANRLRRLKDILNDPTYSIAEKYRKTMEVLFIEAEYGKTVGVYRDSIKLDGSKITGNVLRLGRIAMFFESPDKSKYAVYDIPSSKWKVLNTSDAKDIGIAMEIVEKIRPIRLTKLPIGRVGTQYEIQK